MELLSDQGLIYLGRTAKEAAGVVRTINPATVSEVEDQLFRIPVSRQNPTRFEAGTRCISERR